jgi:hypothetical protein
MTQGKPSSLTSIAFNTGVTLERERIINLWELEMACGCEDAMGHLKERIKGENK